jgi:hypothetical protein
MIPVMAAPEPPTFDSTVRQPGLRFLAKLAVPRNWKNRDYWTAAIPDLRQAYSSTCCYSAEWIPSVTGNSSVDHFVPRAERPDLAYEWSNFRLAAARLNARKGATRGILDPFQIGEQWFALDFPSLLVKRGDALPPQFEEAFTLTVRTLRLNDEMSVDSRMRWLRDYCEQRYTFDYLLESAPFIARELQRQELTYVIREMMNFA